MYVFFDFTAYFFPREVIAVKERRPVIRQSAQSSLELWTAFPLGAKKSGGAAGRPSEWQAGQPTPETHSSYRPINEAFRFITRKTDASPGAEEGWDPLFMRPREQYWLNEATELLT